MDEDRHRITAVIADLRNDYGEVIVGELLSIYLDESARFMHALETALSDADLASAASHAHGLKGSVANFGATSAAAVANELEKCLKARAGISTFVPLVQALRDRFLAVRALLEMELRGVHSAGTHSGTMSTHLDEAAM